VSEPSVTTIDVEGFPVRVWRKGEGPTLGFFAGLGGLPRWVPFLDRLAERRTVIVPSLPGFPGGDRAHSVLDGHLDWVVAARRIVVESGLDGADLVGSSVGGALAAEMAALWPRSVRRLALVAPFGLFAEDDPPENPFAQRQDDIPGLLCADPEMVKRLRAQPEGANSAEWQIEQNRAAEAAARLLWPLGDTRLARRLGYASAPTLLIWGEKDRIMPRSYAKRFADLLGGPSELRVIADAGHLAELDKPDEVAAAVIEWTEPHPSRRGPSARSSG
jgi:pimeloyl-ACP methyl ester carboxylesterase